MPTFSYDAKNKTGDAFPASLTPWKSAGPPRLCANKACGPRGIEAVGAGAFASASPLSSPSGVSYGSGTPSPTAPPLGAQTRVDAAPFLVAVPLPTLVMMYRQLATLLNAGVPMVQALTTLVNQTTTGGSNKSERNVAYGGRRQSAFIGDGNATPPFLPSWEIEMIRAGEASGMLEKMCNRIADYLEREVEIRRKLKRETLYPKIVLFVAGCVLLLLGFLQSGATGVKGRLLFAVEVGVGGSGCGGCSGF